MDVPTEATLAAHEIANGLRIVMRCWLKLDEPTKAMLSARGIDSVGMAILSDSVERLNPLPDLSEDDKQAVFQWLCEQEGENCDTVRNRVRGQVAFWTDVDWFQEAANKADYEKAMAEEDADIPNMVDPD